MSESDIRSTRGFVSDNADVRSTLGYINIHIIISLYIRDTAVNQLDLDPIYLISPYLDDFLIEI